MDKAVLGYCRLGYFRLGVLRDDWNQLLKRFENLASTNVTHRRLMLGNRDATTGWYSKSYEATTIQRILASKTTSPAVLPPGVYVRLDAVGLTADPVYEGDQIRVNSQYYQVETVRAHYIGDSFYFRECDLTLLPFENISGSTYTSSSVEDARYRTKVYLETYLDSDALPNFIVAYGKPDYPMTRVFKTKGVDLVYSIGEPESTPLLGHDLTPYGYVEHVPIETYCIDKDNIDGAKLKWQAEAELRRVTETYPTGSLRTLERRGDNDVHLGSTILYSARFILNYRRDTT